MGSIEARMATLYDVYPLIYPINIHANLCYHAQNLYITCLMKRYLSNGVLIKDFSFVVQIERPLVC